MNKELLQTDKKTITTLVEKTEKTYNRTIPRIACMTVHTCVHTRTHVKYSTVLLFKERETQAKCVDSFREKSTGGGIVIMMRWGSVMGIIILVGRLIKTSFLEHSCTMYIEV